jgi:hypothetical protein
MVAFKESNLSTVRAELEDYAPEQLGELGIRDADIERVAEAAARS